MAEDTEINDTPAAEEVEETPAEEGSEGDSQDAPAGEEEQG